MYDKDKLLAVFKEIDAVPEEQQTIFLSWFDAYTLRRALVRRDGQDYVDSLRAYANITNAPRHSRITEGYGNETNTNIT